MPDTDAGEETGDVARSCVAGDASGVTRGLGERKSAATREGRAWVTSVRAGVTTDAGGVAGTGGDVSSVTGIGTGGGAGSSNAAHGSSSSDAPRQPPTALAPPDSAGALSNSSVRERRISWWVQSPEKEANTCSSHPHQR